MLEYIHKFISWEDVHMPRHACVCTYMQICAFTHSACIFTCIHNCAYSCVNVSTCMYVAYKRTYMFNTRSSLCVCVYTWMHAYIHTYILYIYIYIYIYDSTFVYSVFLCPNLRFIRWWEDCARSLLLSRQICLTLCFEDCAWSLLLSRQICLTLCFEDYACSLLLSRQICLTLFSLQTMGKLRAKFAAFAANLSNPFFRSDDGKIAREVHFFRGEWAAKSYYKNRVNRHQLLQHRHTLHTLQRLLHLLYQVDDVYAHIHYIYIYIYIYIYEPLSHSAQRLLHLLYQVDDVYEHIHTIYIYKYIYMN
jgi:hypothetical protein